MKKSLLFSLFGFVFLFATAQYTFVKKWDNRFGGLFADVLSTIKQTADNGYILVGSSGSDNTGDKTQSNWDITHQTRDYWVVKVDSAGNKVWDKRFGGTDQEGLYSLKQTIDKGYILGGDSYSQNNGDKTQTSRGNGDFWLVKIDSNGNKEWDRRYGGTSDDVLSSLFQTNDNGFLLAGPSFSGNNGDKTQASWGLSDFWIVKIDSVGNKLWDKRFGGANIDHLTSSLPSKNGGYILGGNSSSGISGDKTQPNWDTVTNSYDFWIVKTDSLGNKEWDKRFGGLSSEYLSGLCQTTDGGYILGGISYSGISGDKTVGAGGYWLVKIDTLGNKQWDKLINHVSSDYTQINSLSPTLDGGFLITNVSSQSAGGDKSEDNLGPQQTWVVKVDSLGSIEWDKTIFTTGTDKVGYCIQTNDGCYVVGNYTMAGIGGYKTESNWDTTNQSNDYWIMKFCMDTMTGIDDRYETQDTRQIQIYPNPFTNDLSIALKGENIHEASFTITNAIGQTIYHKEENNLATGYTKMLDLSYLPNGVYFVEVITGGEKIVQQIVKE